MRRPTPEPIEAGGQDSFVDVVTNLVGILIVLVLLVGVRVQPVGKAAQRAEAAQRAATGAATGDDAALAHLQVMSDNVTKDILQTTNQLKRLEHETVDRAREAERLATLVAAGDHALAERRAQLDQAARADFDLRQQMAGLQAEAAKDQQELARAESIRAPAVELKHYLTPLSRTVFGKEAHFRLEKGRIAFVPMEELMDRAKSEVQRITSPSELTDQVHTVGPCDGFQMEFTMQMKTERGGGSVGYGLKEMRIVPVAGQVGEPVREALGPNSELRRRLALLAPKETTVTIWVYNDSFSDYRALNDDLCQAGFAVAARPLPPGMPISGSDHGTRSAAQ